MKYVLIHKLIPGVIAQKEAKHAVDIVKKLIDSPSEVVPGGKLLMSFNAINEWKQICVWEAPSAESFIRLFDALKDIGIATEIKPVEDLSKALSKWEASI